MFDTAERTDICNFADDTTPYSSHHNLKEAMTNVEHDCAMLVEWFRDNFMTLNAEKCHLLVSGYKEEMMFAKVGDALIWKEYVAKLLGILIESHLSFDKHVKMIIKMASTAMSRIADIISKEKKSSFAKNLF